MLRNRRNGLKNKKTYIATVIIAIAVLILMQIDFCKQKEFAAAQSDELKLEREIYITVPTPKPEFKYKVKAEKPLAARQLKCVSVHKAEKDFNKIQDCPWSQKTQRDIFYICHKRNISFELCIAQAKRESNWNARALGDDGQAYGAWQIHPAVWQSVIRKMGYTWDDMFNQVKAADVYTYIMRSHFQRYDDVEFALLAWRWGGNDALQIISTGINSSYVNEILKNTQKFERR